MRECAPRRRCQWSVVANGASGVRRQQARLIELAPSRACGMLLIPLAAVVPAIVPTSETLFARAEAVHTLAGELGPGA